MTCGKALGPIAILLAWSCPALADAADQIAQVHEAIEGGRLIQARAMLDKFAGAGMAGPALQMAQADLALAAREDEVALAFYRPLAVDSAKAAEGAGIAALRLNRAEAEAYLRKAVTAAPDLWRAWDGLGVAMDRRGHWAEAGAAYSRALALRPNEPAILANSGYSMFLQRRLDEAALLLDRAAAGAPDNKTISANRDIVAVLRGRFPESKPAGQSMDEWARRLNNAGYAAFAAGDRATAEALISRAMIASEIYYRRAAANLARVAQARP